MKKIFFAALIAGSLDSLAAILLFSKHYTLHSMSGVFRYISRGVFGKTVAPYGIFYPIAGLILHFLIASIWSALYMLVLYKLFKPGGVWAKTLFFGSLIWVGMNAFVLPVVGLSPQYDGWSMMESFSVILICVALPICLIAEKRTNSAS